jgi:hypothetical protein
VSNFDAVEEVCAQKRTALVIHPAVRQAIRGYEESFYVGLRCFLAGEQTASIFCRSGRVTMSGSDGHRRTRIEVRFPPHLKRARDCRPAVSRDPAAV